MNGTQRHIDMDPTEAGIVSAGEHRKAHSPQYEWTTHRAVTAAEKSAHMWVALRHADEWRAFYFACLAELLGGKATP